MVNPDPLLPPVTPDPVTPAVDVTANANANASATVNEGNTRVYAGGYNAAPSNQARATQNDYLTCLDEGKSFGFNVGSVFGGFGVSKGKSRIQFDDEEHVEFCDNFWEQQQALNAKEREVDLLDNQLETGMKVGSEDHRALSYDVSSNLAAKFGYTTPYVAPEPYVAPAAELKPAAPTKPVTSGPVDLTSTFTFSDAEICAEKWIYDENYNVLRGAGYDPERNRTDARYRAMFNDPRINKGGPLSGVECSNLMRLENK